MIKLVDFKTRFLKSLIAPRVFLFIGALGYVSWHKPYIWIVTFVFVVTFVMMKFRAMRSFLTKIELKEDCLEIVYLKFDKQMQPLKIPLNELTTAYFSNGKGISTLVSYHIGIGQKGKVLIRQYKTSDWTLDLMQSVHAELKELRKK